MKKSDLRKNPKRKSIHASEDTYTQEEKVQIIDALKSRGIDYKKHNYQIKWREYDGFLGERGDHSAKISAPGDYLALFALLLKCPVTWSNLAFQWSVEDLLWYFEKYPSIEALKDGPCDEWACPDEYSATFFLKNLDTGKVLWDREYEEISYEEEFDEEDEDWN